MSALEILNYGEEKKRQFSCQALYRELKISEIYPVQTLKENIVRWIKTSPLDAKDKVSSKVINDVSCIPKHQKQW